MRIGEIARLTGVSARSIRHYHRLGILDEPARTPGGYRQYDVADLARIARIAFLSDSGVPLREIGSLLEPGPRDPATDLDALRAGIDDRIAELTRQRRRLDVVAERVAAGLPPGLLPEPVSRALDVCRADAADDPGLVALVDRERDLLDLLALSGAEFPAPLVSSYTAMADDPGRRRSYLDLLTGFHQIEGQPPWRVEHEIARLAGALVSDPDLRALIAGSGVDDHRPATAAAEPTLDQLVSDPAQREVVRRVLDALGATS